MRKEILRLGEYSKASEFLKLVALKTQGNSYSVTAIISPKNFYLLASGSFHIFFYGMFVLNKNVKSLSRYICKACTNQIWKQINVYLLHYGAYVDIRTYALNYISV